jgi:hypothetical protein
VTYVRVRVLRTGHQVDILSEHYDPTRHVLIPRFPPVATPRRPKFRVKFRRTASVESSTVEGSALPYQAGTGEKEVEP